MGASPGLLQKGLPFPLPAKGKMLVTFDNSYSALSSKTFNYKIDVVDPKAIDVLDPKAGLETDNSPEPLCPLDFIEDAYIVVPRYVDTTRVCGNEYADTSMRTPPSMRKRVCAHPPFFHECDHARES